MSTDRAQRITDDTSIYEILGLISRAGHTTLIIDDVAANYELHERYDIGLHSRISIIPHGDPGRPKP